MVYPSDGCTPGGGVWLNPCEHPPPQEPITAFEVTVTQAAAGDFHVTVALTSRDATYDGSPVAVAVGNQRVVLDTVGEIGRAHV